MQRRFSCSYTLSKNAEKDLKYLLHKKFVDPPPPPPPPPIPKCLWKSKMHEERELEGLLEKTILRDLIHICVRKCAHNLSKNLP